MKVVKLFEFQLWLDKQSAKVQALIEERIFRLEFYDYFGDTKNLREGLAELRWKNGLRVYFARIENRTFILIYGGNKNDQKKDIKKARLLLGRYEDNEN